MNDKTSTEQRESHTYMNYEKKTIVSDKPAKRYVNFKNSNLFKFEISAVEMKFTFAQTIDF
ncbi:hypothetical protein DERF_004578 [Dermatophagoides farinae]|uniref:Uncharacterized protein n=1 Tax=Dermatophagoides farinae TaxID=6954 RepID=A0A922I1R3_DERFA|nr:hypothetical protein DERF_004578 [Dermatophagoides farinae]